MEYNTVLLLVKDLSKQVQHFEQLKEEYDVRQKELNEKEIVFSKLAKEAAGTLEVAAGLVRNENLKYHLKSLKDAFSELGKKSPSQTEIEDECPVPQEEAQNEAVDQEVPEAGEKEQEVLLMASFPEANHVELALAPWNWNSKKMEKFDDGWKTRARIPLGHGVQFKFIVDGVWRCSENYPIIRDTTFENNFIDCI